MLKIFSSNRYIDSLYYHHPLCTSYFSIKSVQGISITLPLIVVLLSPMTIIISPPDRNNRLAWPRDADMSRRYRTISAGILRFLNPADKSLASSLCIVEIKCCEPEGSTSLSSICSNRRRSTVLISRLPLAHFQRVFFQSSLNPL